MASREASWAATSPRGTFLIGAALKFVPKLSLFSLPIFSFWATMPTAGAPGFAEVPRTAIVARGRQLKIPDNWISAIPNYWDCSVSVAFAVGGRREKRFPPSRPSPVIPVSGSGLGRAIIKERPP